MFISQKLTTNGILPARKEPLKIFMIEWEHYTTMAENFSVLTSPLTSLKILEKRSRTLSVEILFLLYTVE